MNRLSFKIIRNMKVYDIPDDVCRELLKRGDEHLKNTFPTRIVLFFLNISDNIREKIAKPVFRSMPLNFKTWYDKVRYRV